MGQNSSGQWWLSVGVWPVGRRTRTWGSPYLAPVAFVHSRLRLLLGTHAHAGSGESSRHLGGLVRSWYWKFDEMWKHLRFYLLLERRQTDADAPMRYSDYSPYLSPNRSSDWDAGEEVSQSWVCWFVCTRCAACSPGAPAEGVCMEGETRDSGDSSSLTHSRTDRSRHTEGTRGELRMLGAAFLLRSCCSSGAPDHGTRCTTRPGRRNHHQQSGTRNTKWLGRLERLA